MPGALCLQEVEQGGDMTVIGRRQVVINWRQATAGDVWAAIKRASVQAGPPADPGPPASLPGATQRRFYLARS